jgi:hypothetical protein
LLTDLRDLRGVEANLARAGARVVDVEDVLEMAVAVGAAGTGNRSRMEGAAFEERAAEERIERGERGDQAADAGRAWVGCSHYHLYR